MLIFFYKKIVILQIFIHLVLPIKKNQMKKILLFLSVCFSINFSVAQSLSPQIISTSGTSFIGSSAQLDWTLGEPVTAALTNSNNILTQGFQQPNLLTTAIDDVPADYSVTIFPNPAIDFVNLQIQNALNESLLIDLYTIEGKLLKSQQINSSTHLQIDMTAYSSGTYLLSIKNSSAKIKSFRIIKSN